ncbi:MAG: zinc-ribbon domain-containing protein [Pseudomonadota bacterium]
MRIVCPNCGSQYEVDASLFGPEGREVQCSQCDTQWTQYPLEEEEAPGPMPSDALAPEERDAIRAAVEEEVAIRDRPAPPPQAPSGEDDLIRSLREQLSRAEAEEEDDIPDVRRPTGRRNLAVAADMAGVDVSEDDDLGIDERGRGRPRTRVKTRVKTTPGNRDLAAALEEYERERRPRRSGRWGFFVALFLGAIAAGAYVGRAEITARVPEAAPALEVYAVNVDRARVTAEKLYADGRVFVLDTIESFQTESDAPAE